MSYLDVVFEKLGILRKSTIERVAKEKEFIALKNKLKEQDKVISNYQEEMQRSIDQATIDLRESLEQFEIQNVELDIAKRKYRDANKEKSELEKLVFSGASEDSGLIVREIAFEPQHRQAGISILSYFSRVVENRYPDINVKVRIEQDNELIRLVIETPNGEKEVIEKLLGSYGEVVNGTKSPESLYGSDILTLELKSELRIANARIENQKELILVQGNQIRDLKELFGTSLINSDDHVQYITMAPAFQNNNRVVNLEYASDCKSEVSYLLNEIVKQYEGSNSSAIEELEGLKDSINKKVKIDDKNEVKNSTWLQNLKRVIEEANEKGSKINSIFDSLSEGVVKAQKLAEKYNSIAEWCGAPQIPTSLLK